MEFTSKGVLLVYSKGKISGAHFQIDDPPHPKPTRTIDGS
jgi:hypothetical protein